MGQGFESRQHFYYAGSIILMALLVGGGTSQQLWSDRLIEIMLLPALFFGLRGLAFSPIQKSAKLLVIGILGFLAMQFFPIQRVLQDLPGSLAQATSPLLSRDIGRSLEAVLFAVTVLGYFLYLTRFPKLMQRRLLSFLLIGFFANFTVMVVQLSFNNRVPIENILPFKITAGFFANQNHASTLVFITIPVLAYLFVARERRIFLYSILVAFEVAVLFAQGSRAGMVISMALGIICLGWFLLPTGRPIMRAAQMMTAIAVVVMIVLLPLNPHWLGDDPRGATFSITLQAISSTWPVGSGLGTFVNLYPGFEPVENIGAGFVNHAHNDYLELLLEGGVVAILLIVVLVALVLTRFQKSAINQAAGIAVLAIGLHSAVDYPLRTFAIAIPFVLFLAILFTPDPQPGGRARRS